MTGYRSEQLIEWCKNFLEKSMFDKTCSSQPEDVQQCLLLNIFLLSGAGLSSLEWTQGGICGMLWGTCWWIWETNPVNEWELHTVLCKVKTFNWFSFEWSLSLDDCRRTWLAWLPGYPTLAERDIGWWIGHNTKECLYLLCTEHHKPLYSCLPLYTRRDSQSQAPHS